MHGWVGPDVLGPLIDQAKVVVAASEWYENSPYSVIEAFAHARPVVASRIGGLPELVADDVSGITVEPRSATEIVAAVERLLDESDLWFRLASGALQKAAARDAGEYAVALERLYARVMAGQDAK
jgi:glycosyltransferase involved in cell wall biosynthesis